MSRATLTDDLVQPARGTVTSLPETLSCWRRWIHMEATRTRPYGRDAPTLASAAQEDRERCEAAARVLMGLGPGRVDPVDTRQLQALLEDLTDRSSALRCGLATGEVITDAPLCGLLATQLAGSIVLLTLLGARAVGRRGGA